MIDGRNFFVQPIKSDLKTYDNIKKIAIGQGDDYTNGCLLDYSYFNRFKQSTKTKYWSKSNKTN